MKSTSSGRRRRFRDEPRKEYRFDYSKARPNRFSGRTEAKPVMVVLDQDVAEVFKDAASVNAALRTLLPRPRKPGVRIKRAS